VLFGLSVLVCASSTAAEERVFSNKTSVREIISPEERSFSLLLFSLKQRERERERKQNNALKVRIKEGKKTRRENPPSEYSSSLFSSCEYFLRRAKEQLLTLFLLGEKRRGRETTIKKIRCSRDREGYARTAPSPADWTR
jgi:hypothetical protein